MLSPDLLDEILAQLDSGLPVSELRAKLQTLRAILLRRDGYYEGPSAKRTRGRNFYETLVADMLALVRSAGSREVLLNLVVERLGQDSDQRVGHGYMVLSSPALTSPDRAMEVTIERIVGFKREREAAFRRAAHADMGRSAIIRSLLIDKENVEFLPLEALRDTLYFGEFDRLYDRNAGAWIGAVALPALDLRKPNRALIGLFPSAGDLDQPLLPRGAAQEWRAFEFLRVAYDLLNHQLASVAEQREAQRRDLLADLAPGIVHHEINQQIRILQSGSNIMNLALRALPDSVADHAATARLVDALMRQYRVLERLDRVASAFNNLGKRGDTSVVQLATLIDEVISLLDFRIAGAGVELSVDIVPADLSVETDGGLLEHVVLNLLMNALDAFRSTPHRDPATDPPHRTIRLAARERQGSVTLLVENNGPPIPKSLRDRIFDKGFSGKPRGQGQGLGLYICRLVMTYLGGAIDVAASGDQPDRASVVFQIRLPRVAPSATTLADEGLIEDPARLARRLRRTFE